MDKMLSTQVDESVLRRLTSLARRLGTSEKAVLERAITDLAERTETETTSAAEEDVLTASFGAWKRDAPPDEVASKAREAFTKSMERHRS